MSWEADERRRGGSLFAVEGLSGYAVRYLKPDVTQSWRVGSAARRPVPGRGEGGPGGERLKTGVEAGRRPRAGPPSLQDHGL